MLFKIYINKYINLYSYNIFIIHILHIHMCLNVCIWLIVPPFQSAKCSESAEHQVFLILFQMINKVFRLYIECLQYIFYRFKFFSPSSIYNQNHYLFCITLFLQAMQYRCRQFKPLPFYHTF